jgi:hypothetical protein
MGARAPAATRTAAAPVDTVDKCGTWGRVRPGSSFPWTRSGVSCLLITAVKSLFFLRNLRSSENVRRTRLGAPTARGGLNFWNLTPDVVLG